MYTDRRDLYEKLALKRQSKILSIVTGDRPGLETQIAPDLVELVGDLLDHYDESDLISVYLYTRGGDTLAGWSLVNLLREFCDRLEIIIPSKCHSCGTLICLGADQLVMTKQATLSPIDPSVNTPLNPVVPNSTQRLPVSVEDVAGFIGMARQEGGLKSGRDIAQVFMKLAEAVNPIVLGRVSRARGQIKDLARKLLGSHMKDQRQIKKIVDLLCVEAGSHDYSIYRTEARKLLKLKIETPTMELYNLIKDIYIDIRKELLIGEPYNIEVLAAGVAPGTSKSYVLTRALLESQSNGAYRFVTKGTVTNLGPNPTGQMQLQYQTHFEGWEPTP